MASDYLTVAKDALARITGVSGATKVGVAAIGDMAADQLQNFLAALKTRTLPVGGTTGQTLKKTSGTDFAVSWQNEAGGAASSTTRKTYVRAATTANITLSGLQTVDTVALANDDPVLVKDQSTGSQNGIYLAKSAGAWVRRTDADTGVEWEPGTLVHVSEGGQGDSLWQLTNNSVPSIGSTALTFGRVGPTSVSPASETVAGITEYSTQAETDAGINNSTAITPLKFKSSNASPTNAGVTLLDTAPVSASSPIAIGRNAALFETHLQGFAPTWASPGTNFNNITFSSGSVWVPGLFKILNFPSAITLPTGTPTANTWYHVYAYDAGGNTPALEAVTTAPSAAYKGTARTKSTSTSHRYIFSLRANASGRLYCVRYLPGSGRVYYVESNYAGDFILLNAGAATTAALVSCATLVPVTGSLAVVSLINIGTADLYLSTPGGNAPTTGGSGQIWVDNGHTISQVFVPLNASQQFQYHFSGAGSTTDIFLNAYAFER